MSSTVPIRIQVPKNQVFTRSQIMIPDPNNLNTLYLRTLDPYGEHSFTPDLDLPSIALVAALMTLSLGWYMGCLNG